MISHIVVVSKSIESYVILIQSRSMSDPTFSDIDLKLKWLEPGLPLIDSSFECVPIIQE